MAIFAVVFYFVFCRSASADNFTNTTGDMTIPSGTTLVVDGDKWIRGGDLIVSSGAILQINSYSSLQFEPGHKIILSGGQIFQSGNHGIIKKGDVVCECIAGDCCDGCLFRPITYTCGYSAYNDCNGSCLKKRDIYKCSGAAATCPTTDQGDSLTNIPSGYVCTGSGSQTAVSSSSYCYLDNYCSNGSCSGTRYYTSCNGSGSCRVATDHTDSASTPVSASAGKILTSTCTNQDASASVSCSSAVNSCSSGSCSGTKKYPECNGSGTCDTAATSYYQAETIYASPGYTLTSSCTNGTTLCGYSGYNGCAGVGSPYSCQKKRDQLRCDASHNCAYDVGDSLANVAPGNVCYGSGLERSADCYYYCSRGAPYTCLGQQPREQAYGCSAGACSYGIGECGRGSACGGIETNACEGGSCGGTCLDSKDNDGDGYTDGQDPDCKGEGECSFGDCCDISTGSFKASGTVCRASAGVCDVAETCNGSSATCPTDSFRPSTYTCGYSAYNDCNGSCLKKRDIYKCSGAAATCQIGRAHV